MAEHARRETRDAGFTITELLIATVITGVMLSSIAFSLLFVLNSNPRIEGNTSEARDISFVQAWLPVDISSATETTADPLSDPTSGNTLPGTNVLLIERRNLEQLGQPNYFVSYRYTQWEGEWALVRYEIRNPGLPEEFVSAMPITRNLAPPPAEGWDPTMPPTHAADVSLRNPTDLRRAGADVFLTFASGETTKVGGAGLGTVNQLSDTNLGGYADPPAPPNRCGGGVTLVLDSSGSIGGNMFRVEDAAKEIVTQFLGTPTELRIIDFDSYVSPVAPSTWNGPAVDMLTMTIAQRDALHNQIDAALVAGGGTNWEAGLRMALTDWPQFSTVAPSPHMPQLVIFVTDGDPTAAVDDAGNIQWSSNMNQALRAAREISENRSEWGVELKGIYVAPGGGTNVSQPAKRRLQEIVGSVEWVSSPSDPVGNADVASFFTGDPSELASIFQQLFVADCGGTVTIRKQIDNGGGPVPATRGVWSYSTDAGMRQLDAARTPAITIGFETNSGRWVAITESVVPGRTLTDVECSSRGIDVTASRVRALNDTDGSPLPNGREVFVSPNEALSCVFTSS